MEPMERILVVEPDRAVGRLLETALQLAGYQVRLVSSVEEAYGFLRRSRVAMVLADLNLPGGTGLHMISVVREQFPCTKIVGISPDASEYDPVQAAPLLETLEVLPNPIRVHDVVETVQRVLGSP